MREISDSSRFNEFKMSVTNRTINCIDFVKLFSSGFILFLYREIIEFKHRLMRNLYVNYYIETSLKFALKTSPIREMPQNLFSK